MSENKGDATNKSENEPEVIYVQYDGDLEAVNQNILLQVTEKAFKGPRTQKEQINKEISGENHVEIIEEVDSPDLVNIEDFKTSETFADSPENEKDQNTAALCETTLESDLTSTLNETQKDEENVNFFQLVNVETEEQEPVNIITDIPNEVLVYTCQPENEDALNKYSCKNCGIIVGCIFCLKSHYESIHLNLGIIQYKCDQTSYLKSYTEICHKCNLVCESKEEMFEHRKIHFVSCDVCDMSFDSALFLSNHCKTSHEKFEVIISCDLCEQWFKQLQDLSNHYESYHGMILCIVCFKRFATIPEMEKHHRSHKIVLKHTDAVLPYACSKCNQAFGEICELSSHLTKIHSKKRVNHNDGKVAVKVSQNRKKTRSKREMKFDDCGGLSQVVVIIEDKDKKKRKLKREED